MKTTTTTREDLRKLETFRLFDDAELDLLAAIAKNQTVSAGTILFSEGDEQTNLYFVIDGSLRLQMVTSQGGSQTILSVGSSELLAWTAIVGVGTMTATAIAAESSRVIALPAQELRQLLDANPQLGYRFMCIVAAALSRRLLATRLQMLDLL